MERLRSVHTSTLVLLSVFAAAFAMLLGQASGPVEAGGSRSYVDGSGRTVARGSLQPAGFTVEGKVNRQLVPGRIVRINLRLTNPTRVDLDVTRLSVKVSSVTSDGQASTCHGADFTVLPATLGAGVRLPAGSRGTLGRLGLHRTRWPAVGLLDLPVNQDDCKGVTLTLTYSGSAERVT